MKKNYFESQLWALMVSWLAPGLLIFSISALLFYFSDSNIFNIYNIIAVFVTGLILSVYQAKVIVICDTHKWIINQIIIATCQAAVFYSLLLPIKYYKEINITLYDVMVITFALAILCKSWVHRSKKRAKRPSIAEWWKREIGKNNWHGLKILLVPLSVALTWLLYLPIAFFYNIINPAHSGVGPFSYTGGIGVVALQILIGVALFIPAMFLACIAMNLIYWCIPPARRAFAKEAEHDPNRSFKATTEELFHHLKRYLPLGYIAALLGTIAFRLI